MTGRSEDAWLLSVDFGTTATAAAMTVGEKAEVVDIDNAPRMPSMVCWKEPSNGTPGQLLLGDAAENEAVLAPQCAERSPKRKIAQEFILLGSERIRVTDAIGQIFEHVLDQAVPVHGGRRPDELRITHPARWGEGRLARLRAAAAVAGFDDPLLVPEPVGAAVYFAAGQLLPGDYVAVYDLGGGTFDTAVLQRAEIGFEVIGEPGGRDDLGGEDFDDRLYRYLGRRLDPEQWQTLIAPDSGRSWQRAHYDFKQDVRRAKEHLSRYPDATVRTPIPDGEDIDVSRPEFEALIREDIESTVAELERTIMAAGHSVDDLAAIYIAGGSSRIPLIWRRIEERLGKQPSTFGDPKAVIALGAARVHLPTSSKPVSRNETATTGVGETPPTDPPRPPGRDERAGDAAARARSTARALSAPPLRWSVPWSSSSRSSFTTTRTKSVGSPHATQLVDSLSDHRDDSRAPGDPPERSRRETRSSCTAGAGNIRCGLLDGLPGPARHPWLQPLSGRRLDQHPRRSSRDCRERDRCPSTAGDGSDRPRWRPFWRSSRKLRSGPRLAHARRFTVPTTPGTDAEHVA